MVPWGINLSSVLAQRQVQLYQNDSQLPSVKSLLKTKSDGYSTTCLGNLFQCLLSLLLEEPVSSTNPQSLLLQSKWITLVLSPKNIWLINFLAFCISFGLKGSLVFWVFFCWTDQASTFPSRSCFLHPHIFVSVWLHLFETLCPKQADNLQQRHCQHHNGTVQSFYIC